MGYDPSWEARSTETLEEPKIPNTYERMVVKYTQKDTYLIYIHLIYRPSAGAKNRPVWLSG